MHLEVNIQNYVFYAILLFFCLWNTFNTYKVRNETGIEYKSKKHDIKITNKPALVLLIFFDIIILLALIGALLNKI